MAPAVSQHQSGPSCRSSLNTLIYRRKYRSGRGPERRRSGPHRYVDFRSCDNTLAQFRLGPSSVLIYTLDRAKAQTPTATTIDPMLIEKFTQAMRQNLRSGEAPFRKAYLRSVVGRIEVDDGEIRIMGRKDVLERAVSSGGMPLPQQVRGFVREWRTRQDSNL